MSEILSACALNINSTQEKEALASGLVLSKTSDTDTIDTIGQRIDTKAARQARLRRSVLNAANYMEKQLNQQGGKRYKKAMLTLTYSPENDYSPLHITALLKRIRAYLDRKGYSFYYVWVLENTKKNRPHYHIVLWLPKGVTLPKPDKRGWWSQGSTKIEWVRKNAAAYIAKYCAKPKYQYGTSDNYTIQNQGEFPKGARLHGCGGLDLANRWRRSWWNLPVYVRKAFPKSDLKVVPAKGGGYVSRETGEFLESPFKVLFSPLRVVKRDYFDKFVKRLNEAYEAQTLAYKAVMP